MRHQVNRGGCRQVDRKLHPLFDSLLVRTEIELMESLAEVAELPHIFPHNEE